MDTQFELNFRILEITSLQFKAKELNEDDLELLFGNPEPVNVDLHTELLLDDEDCTLTIDINTVFSRSDTKEELISHSGRTTYLLYNIETVYTKENNTYNVPEPVAIQLIGLAIAHVRAAIMNELGPDKHNDRFIVPVIKNDRLLSTMRS